MYGMQPSMIFQGFEGGASISQKNLEQARAKFMIDKLTRKLPPDVLKGNTQGMLPPIKE